MWYISENEESNRGTSEEVDEQDVRETIDISNSWFYHEVTVSS